jgi:hypothetical protein
VKLVSHDADEHGVEDQDDRERRDGEDVQSSEADKGQLGGVRAQQVRRGESENQTQTQTHNESDDGDDDDADGPRHVRVGGEGETLPTEDHREGEEHDEGGAVDQPEYQREVVSASVNPGYESYMRREVIASTWRGFGRWT